MSTKVNWTFVIITCEILDYSNGSLGSDEIRWNVDQVNNRFHETGLE